MCSGNVRTIERYLELPQGPACRAVLNRYSNNKVLVVISNTGTFGSIIQARKEQSLRGGQTFHVSMSLGDRNDCAPELCARMVLEAVQKKWGRERAFPTIVFCLGVQRQGLMHKPNLDHIVQSIVTCLDELFS